jgi:multidrug efflux pump subunit AcrA (membrane-fusion protein)
MDKKKLGYIGGAIVLVIAAWMYFGSSEEEATAIMAQPQKGPFEVAVTATGELRAKNSTKIMGPSGARRIGVYQMQIQKLVPEGTVVEKGDFVAELDKSEVMSKLQETKLNLEKVQSQYTQAKLDTSLTLTQARDELVNLEYAVEEQRLVMEQSKYESPSVKRQAEIDYEKAKRRFNQAKKSYKTQVKQAVAKMKEVETELTKAQNEMKNIQNTMQEFTVMAPEKGMVVYDRNWDGRKVTEGSTIRVWNPVVAELPDLSTMESVTYINEVDIQKIEKGQSVRIGLDANPDKKLTGKVNDVANIGEERPNSDSKVFEVVIEVAQKDTTLRPAMTTSNSIVVQSMDEALYVPLETIFSDDSLTYVYKQNGMSVVKQEVALGPMNDSDVVINAGIKPEDQLYMSIPADTTGIAFQRLETGENSSETLAERKQ